MYSTINDLIMLFSISLNAIYFDNISLLLAVFTSERPFCLQIEPFVLDVVSSALLNLGVEPR